MPDQPIVDQLHEQAERSVEQMQERADQRRADRDVMFDQLRAVAALASDDTVVAAAIRALAELYEVSLAPTAPSKEYRRAYRDGALAMANALKDER